MPWFRIDIPPPSPATLASAGRLPAQVEASWNIRIDDDAVVVVLGSTRSLGEVLGLTRQHPPRDSPHPS